MARTRRQAQRQGWGSLPTLSPGEVWHPPDAGMASRHPEDQ